MVPPGYILGQVAAPRVEEPEEPLYVNAKQVSVCLFLVYIFSFLSEGVHYLQRDSLDGEKCP